MRRLLGLTILVAVLMLRTSDEAGAGCSNPALGMKAGQQNVDSETVSFSFRGDSFALDIYSGFAPLTTNPTRVFCIRYEVVNRSEKAVQKLYWPLASGLQIESLQPQARPSIAITTPPGAPPIIGSAWVYAFLSEASKTLAYQQNKQYLPLLLEQHPPVLEGNITRPAATLASYAPHMAQIEGYELKEPRNFPDIGTEFTDHDTEIGAASIAEWDGKHYTIRVRLERSNPFAKEVQAPFAFALFKAGSTSDLLNQIREFKKAGVPVPFRENVFQSIYRSTPASSSLYIVQQPITLIEPYGRVCFLAPAYSPIPIPENFMSCSVTSL